MSRFAGVSEAGARRRNPERSEGPCSSSGGGRGIRTPGTLSGTAVFKTARFDRSRIPPDVSFHQFTSIHTGLISAIPRLQPRGRELFESLDALGDAEVNVVPAQLLFEGGERGGAVNEQKFHARHLGEIFQTTMAAS